MARFEEFTPEEVCDYVQEQVPQIEIYYKIDGEMFLVLNDEYLREVAPLLGDRLKIKKIIVRLQADESLVSSKYIICTQMCL